MLFFHGISCDERAARRIAREGLRPFRKPWVEPWLAGADRGVVFLSCSPTAGRGGDPLAFARGHYGRARAGSDPRRTSGWMFVVDLPRERVRASVPNLVLEHFFRVRAFRDAACGLRERDWQYFAARAERGDDVRDRLEHVVIRAPGDLLDPLVVDALAHGILAAPSRRAKRAIARSFGVTLDPRFLDDPHIPFCPLCVGYELCTGYRDGDRHSVVIPRTGEWLDRQTMALYLDQHARWVTTTHTVLWDRAGAVEPWRSMASQPWLARELRPDFLTCAIDADLGERDVQVVVDHVPPEAIVALVQVSVDGYRLSPRVRDATPTVGAGLYREARAMARERRVRLRNA